MQGGVIELARQAAAAARAEQGWYERGARGNKAKPNPAEPPAPAPVAGGGGGALAAHAGVLPLAGHTRMRAPLLGQQPAPPQAPAAPVGGGAQRQAFSTVQQAPPPHFGTPQVPYHRGAAPPAFSGFLYPPPAGPAFAAAAERSNGVGFYAAGPAAPARPRHAQRYASAAADPKLLITIESDSDDEAVVEDSFTPSDHGSRTSSPQR